MKNNKAATIKQLGIRWMVVVQDAPQAGHPTVPCHHTAGVYYSESEAISMRDEIQGGGH